MWVVTTLGFGWVHYSFAFPVFSFLYSVRRQIPGYQVPGTRYQYRTRPTDGQYQVKGEHVPGTSTRWYQVEVQYFLYFLCFEFLLMFLKILCSGKRIDFQIECPHDPSMLHVHGYVDSDPHQFTIISLQRNN